METYMKRILDLASGPNKTVIEGAEVVGLDIYPFDGVDCTRDVLRGIPYNDDWFDGVICKHFIEHVQNEDLIFVIEEMWRVCKDDSEIFIICPDHSSPNIRKDPLHLTHTWYADSFDFWEVDKDGNHKIFRGPHYNCNAKLHLVETSVNQNLDRMYRLKVIKP
jgi:SAM-dependent methyltransferase